MSVLTNLGKVGLISRGTYSPSETYNRLDFVLYGASSFVCLETVTGEAPNESEKWQALALGSDGGSLVIDKEAIVRAGGVTSVNSVEPSEGNVDISAESLNAVPKARTINTKSLESDIILTADDLEAVPTTRTVNSKSLESDITLTAEDVEAVPTSRKINGKPLTDDITLTASDIGIDPEGGGTVKKVNNVNPDISGNVTLTADDLEAVPKTRTVNGHELSSDITLTAEDLGIGPGGEGTVKSVNEQTPDDGGNVTLTAENVNAVPTTRKINGHELTEDISLNATDVNAKSADYEPDLSGYVPKTTKVNLKPLAGDVTITADDISAVPTSRTVNNKSLISDVTLLASDVNAFSKSDIIPLTNGGTGASTPSGARTNLGISFVLDGTTLRITVE